MQTTNFEIDRDAVKNYFLAIWILVCISIFVLYFFIFALGALDDDTLLNHQLVGINFAVSATESGELTVEKRPMSAETFAYLVFFVLIVPLSFLVALLAFAYWLCNRQATNLCYRLEGSTLRADGGVFFLFRKSIPLERITDVALVQGPLLRFFNIWAMRIQTAGSAQCEATLYGVRNPEEIRELILSRRKQVYGEKTEDA